LVLPRGVGGVYRASPPPLFEERDGGEERRGDERERAGRRRCLGAGGAASSLSDATSRGMRDERSEMWATTTTSGIGG
jgi:hypothetical protein